MIALHRIIGAVYFISFGLVGARLVPRVNAIKKGWEGRTIKRSLNDPIPQASLIIEVISKAFPPLTMLSLLPVVFPVLSSIVPGFLTSGLAAASSSAFESLARVVGLLVLLGHHYLYDHAMAMLNKDWDIAPVVRDGQKLVTRGVYGYIRHPIYTSTMLGCVSALLLGDCAIVLLLKVALCVLACSRWRVEEQLMAMEFGAEYDRYLKQTGAFFPVSATPFNATNED